MAKHVIYLTKIPAIECGNKFGKSIEKYFKTLGSNIHQLKVQAKLIDDLQCRQEFIDQIYTAEALLDEVTGILSTNVFTKMKNKVDEMEYKAREFIKDIDSWMQKHILEIATKILSFFGVPNILKLPIPFMTGVTLLDDSGQPYRYTPLIIDIFSKSGKQKIKAAMAEDLDSIKKFFSDEDSYDGEWSIVSPDHKVEELWQRLMNEVNKLMNITIGDLINAMWKYLKKVPVIGQLIEALGAFVDPTVPIDKIFQTAWNNAKKKYQDIRNKVISGELKADALDAANKIVDALIDKVLGIGIPLFGTIGDALGINPEEDFKKLKITSKDKILAKIKDGWNNLKEKIKRFFETDWMKKMYDILLKLPSIILKQFPIIKDIIAWCEAIIDLLTGKVDGCFVMTKLLPVIPTLGQKMFGGIGGCVTIEYTEYGYLPPDIAQIA